MITSLHSHEQYSHRHTTFSMRDIQYVALQFELTWLLRYEIAQIMEEYDMDALIVDKISIPWPLAKCIVKELRRHLHTTPFVVVRIADRADKDKLVHIDKFCDVLYIED